MAAEQKSKKGRQVWRKRKRTTFERRKWGRRISEDSAV